MSRFFTSEVAILEHMTEKLPIPAHMYVPHLANQYDIGAKASIRRAYMNLSAPGTDFYGGIFRRAYTLGLPPTGSILNIGSGTGEDEYRLATDPEFNHTGEILGLDLPHDEFADRFFAVRQALGNAGVSNVTFVEGNAENLPFEDNKFDAVFCLHMLYYARHIRKVIREIARVVKPEGIVAISSNARANTQRKHSFLYQIGKFRDPEKASFLPRRGRRHPKPLSARFNFEMLQKEFPLFFDYAGEVRQQEPLVIDDEEDIIVALGALDTYRDLYSPPFETTAEWLIARHEVAEKVIRDEIKLTGQFLDRVDRGAIFGTNPEKPTVVQRLGRRGILR